MSEVKVEKKPVICCDLDDVVFDFLKDFIAFIKRHGHRYGVDPEKLTGNASKWDSWDGFEKFGFSEPLFRKALKDWTDRGGMRMLPFVGHQGDTPRYLRAVHESTELHFVSKRSPESIHQSVGALEDRVGFFPRSITHVNSDGCSHYDGKEVRPIPGVKTKRDMFHLIRPDIVIDDNPDYIIEAAEAKTCDIIIVNQTHNKKFRDKSLKLRRFMAPASEPADYLTLDGHDSRIHAVQGNWLTILLKIQAIQGVGRFWKTK